jgi:hypothetical protein
MTMSGAFSEDYATARGRFREAASQLGWTLEAHSVSATGPDGEDLTLDVALSPAGEAGRALVVSSGVHGVEGFLGSAVQLGLLERWARQSAPSEQCVFLHGINPFGFAWLRRFDENNVDPNRNFLLPGERYEGSHADYARLDQFLNPQRPPSRWEPFLLKALWTIVRYGMPTLRQAVAGGQYEFPQGVFYGGAEPSRSHEILRENMERWLQGSRSVVHLDFHTGLGPHTECKLLIDYTLSEQQRDRLTEWFGAGSFESCDASNIAYDTRGGIGRWCVASDFAPDYLFACAEFGTYSPVRVLAGLRAENQAHHWGSSSSASTVRAKRRLKELFCPSSPTWRSRVLEKSLDLVDRSLRGLASVS